MSQDFVEYVAHKLEHGTPTERYVAAEMLGEYSLQNNLSPRIREKLNKYWKSTEELSEKPRF